MKPQGPNVKALVIHKMSLLMIPPGCKNGLATGIAALSKPGNLVAVAREARAWVEAALLAVRQAGEPNPWKDASDEAIAGYIMEQVKAKQRGPGA